MHAAILVGLRGRGPQHAVEGLACGAGDIYIYIYIYTYITITISITITITIIITIITIIIIRYISLLVNHHLIEPEGLAIGAGVNIESCFDCLFTIIIAIVFIINGYHYSYCYHY